MSVFWDEESRERERRRHLHSEEGVFEKHIEACLAKAMRTMEGAFWGGRILFFGHCSGLEACGGALLEIWMWTHLESD